MATNFSFEEEKKSAYAALDARAEASSPVVDMYTAALRTLTEMGFDTTAFNKGVDSIKCQLKQDKATLDSLFRKKEAYLELQSRYPALANVSYDAFLKSDFDTAESIKAAERVRKVRESFAKLPVQEGHSNFMFQNYTPHANYVVCVECSEVERVRDTITGMSAPPCMANCGHPEDHCDVAELLKKIHAIRFCGWRARHPTPTIEETLQTKAPSIIQSLLTQSASY